MALSGPAYCISLLHVSKLLRQTGSAQRKAHPDESPELIQAGILSLIEDCQDSSLTSKEDLINASFLLQEYGQDEEGDSSDIDFFGTILYDQILLRANEFDADEIEDLSAVFHHLSVL